MSPLKLGEVIYVSSLDLCPSMSFYLLTGSTLWQADLMQMGTIKLLPGECRSVDSWSQWSWRDVLIVVGIVSYHEKPFRRETGS